MSKSELPSEDVLYHWIQLVGTRHIKVGIERSSRSKWYAHEIGRVLDLKSDWYAHISEHTLRNIIRGEAVLAQSVYGIYQTINDGDTSDEGMKAISASNSAFSLVHHMVAEPQNLK